MFGTPLGGRWAVSSGYGEPRAYRNGTHVGLDFPCGVGTPVYATASGTVRKTITNEGNYAGLGIFLYHDNEVWQTGYVHLSKVLVQPRQSISRGQLIGISGDTGAGGAHLHYGTSLRRDRSYLYTNAYGVPTQGLNADGNKITGYDAVPSEPFIYADYDSRVRADGSTPASRAAARNIPVYRPVPILKLAALTALGVVALRVWA